MKGVDESEVLSAQAQGRVAEMLPVLDSIIRAMSESDGAYAPEEAEFFWSTLYLMVVNYGEQSGLAQMAEDGRLRAERLAVQEVASACFDDHNDLLDIPEGLSRSVQYNEDEDAYLFAASDIGDSFSEITNVAAQGDFISVTVALKSGDEAQFFVFVLTENTYAQLVAQPTFYFTVKDADKLDA